MPIREGSSGEPTSSRGALESSLVRTDIAAVFGPPMILRMDTGDPVVFLAGVHVGCAELFVNERIRTVRDLKGRRVAIENPRDSNARRFSNGAVARP